MARERFSDEDEDRRDDDRPRRRDDRDDDYDDRRRAPLKKPGLATAAGVLWVIWGAILAILTILSLLGPGSFNIIGIVSLLLSAVAIVICFLGGITTLNGSAKSIKGIGTISLVFSIVYVLLSTGLGAWAASQLQAAGELGGGAAGRQAGAGLGALVIIVMCGGALLLMSGMILASIFAMSSGKKYAAWWQAAKGGGRD